ncbi:hypothetical protein KUW04_11800 [Halomonas denitrificans]|nr:hypothetical protein [Halomonas denitrificans]
MNTTTLIMAALLSAHTLTPDTGHDLVACNDCQTAQTNATVAAASIQRPQPVEFAPHSTSDHSRLADLLNALGQYQRVLAEGYRTDQDFVYRNAQEAMSYPDDFAIYLTDKLRSDPALASRLAELNHRLDALSRGLDLSASQLAAQLVDIPESQGTTVVHFSDGSQLTMAISLYFNAMDGHLLPRAHHPDNSETPDGQQLL